MNINLENLKTLISGAELAYSRGKFSMEEVSILNESIKNLKNKKIGENSNQHLDILIKFILLAQKRGCYSLDESFVLASAKHHIINKKKINNVNKLETISEEDEVVV